MTHREDRVGPWLVGARSGKQYPCPVCGKDDWATSSAVALGAVQIDASGNVQGDIEAGDSLILVPVGCANCGYTVFVDAATAGVIN